MAADLPVFGSFSKVWSQHDHNRDYYEATCEEEQMTMIARGDIIRDCQEKDIYDRFSEIAPVKSVRIIRDRGFAFVDFNTHEDAAQVLEIAKTEHIKIFS